MDPAFALRVAASFLTAGLVVTLAGWLAERLGPRAGGLLAALPSLVIVAYLFIGLQEGGAFVSDAANAFPSTMAANVLFLGAFALLAPLGLARAALGAFPLWAASLVLLERTALAAVYGAGFTVYLGTLAAAAAAFHLTRHHPTAAPSQANPHVPTTPRLRALRFLLAGTAAATALLLARTAGPTIGGLASGAPVIFASTMIFTHRSLGPGATRRIGGAMIGGSFTPVAFAWIAGRVFPHLTPATAALASVALTVPVAALVAWGNRVGGRWLRHTTAPAGA